MADVNTILSDKELTALRGAYDREHMLVASAAAITARDPASEPFVSFATETFFDPKRFPSDARERCFIVLLALTSKGSGLTLAVHLYWGLMEMLSVRDVADTLLFAGTYSGMPNLASGLIVMENTLLTLQDLVKQGGDAMKSPNVVAALMKRFP